MKNGEDLLRWLVERRGGPARSRGVRAHAERHLMASHGGGYGCNHETLAQWRADGAPRVDVSG
jgi:hypothetical protein